jgi:tryptophan 2,3-dioxygenase
VRSLRRISTILRLAVHHFEVMETLTTREYLGFRDKLMGASGFQSAQLRQIEILLGLDDSSRIPLGIEGDYMVALRALDGSSSSRSGARPGAEADMPTLRTAIHAWLYRTPIDGHRHRRARRQERLAEFVERFLESHARFVDGTLGWRCTRPRGADRARVEQRYADEKASVRAFLDAGRRRRRRAAAARAHGDGLHRDLPRAAAARLAARGARRPGRDGAAVRRVAPAPRAHGRARHRPRTGTGGSAGVDYLDSTALRYRVFRDLWAVRTLQIPRAAPALENAAFYDFRVAP